MPHPHELAVNALEALHRDVIAPAVIAARWPLRAAAYQTLRACRYQAALAAAYRPVEPGWEWGPRWSTAWFRLSGPVPTMAGGRPMALRFSTETEALLWVDGVPHAGLDLHRDLAPLPASVTRARRLTLYVEAACNHPFGAAGLQWDPPAEHRRWASPRPGRFHYAELVALNEVVQELSDTWLFALGLVRELTPPSPPLYTPSVPWAPSPPVWQNSRAEQVLAALQAAARELDPGAVATTAGRALSLLRRAFESRGGGSALVAHAVGHAHIDTAWLWRVGETRRKCLRTFANVLRLMEAEPDFTFMCSQSQHMAFVREDAPAIFRQIQRRVREGRWEPLGAMWVEPDALVPSGESLARQLLLGVRSVQRDFPGSPPQRVLFLPDTFGFPPQLPQIMRLAGLDTFITNKLSWNDTTPYPHTTFLWTGLDGSSVAAHFTPNHDYNAAQTPREMLRAQANHRSKQIPSVPTARDKRDRAAPRGARMLHPYGYGDGGGGPTRAMIRATRLAAGGDGLPAFRFSTAREFAEALHADLASARRAGIQIPVHYGPLDLELHRGTYTTQAWIKRAVDRCEGWLRAAELLIAGAPVRSSARTLRRVRAELDRAWKLLLLNQFHDILPGSSIREVYDDARRDLEDVRASAQSLIRTCAVPWWKVIAGRPGSRAAVNPGAQALKHGPNADIAPLGVTILPAKQRTDWAAGPRAVTIVADARRRSAVLRSAHLTIRVDALGRITSLIDGRSSPPGCQLAAAPLNELVLCEDRPALWDAWEIERAAVAHPTPQTQPASEWRVVRDDPDTVAVRVTRPLGHRSRIELTVALRDDHPGIWVHARIRWQEHRRLLRVQFPTTIRAAHADFGTQFGHLLRPATRNSPAEAAAFEVPFHRWVRVSDAHHSVGVAVDHLHGASAHTSPDGLCLGLSLLRSPIYPDPTADRGDHVFTWVIMAPADVGALDEAHAQIRWDSFELDPPRAPSRATPSNAPAHWSPVRLSRLEADDRSSVDVCAFKLAEDPGDDIIIRLAEQSGVATTRTLHWNIPIRRVTVTDLLERPLVPQPPRSVCRHDARRHLTSISLAPFQVLTLRAVRA
jgi:alpha-mannosidase